MRRLALPAVLSICLLSATAAHAALVWSETTERGTPIIRWAMGANINEAHAAAKANAGQPISVITSCRQTGYFAYVSSPGQTQHGVSCGYETLQAALYEARVECEQEGGRCDFERYGYDSGKPIVEGGDETDLATNLPGTTESGGSVATPNAPFVVE